MVRDEAPQPAAPSAQATAEANAEATAEATAAAPAVPAAPEPATLHDFCKGLLGDADLMKAFELDPVGCLTKAGLTDIAPSDVYDVLPLVNDLVPAGAGDLPLVNGLGGISGVGLPGVPDLDSLTSGISLDGEAGADGGWATLSAESPLGTTGAVGQIEAELDEVEGGFQAGQSTPVGDFGAAGAISAGLEGVAANAGVYTPFGTIETGAHVIGGEAGGVAYGGIAIEGPLDKTISVTTEHGLGINQDVLAVPGLSGNVTDIVGNVTDIAGKGVTDPTALTGAVFGVASAVPSVGGLQLPLSDVAGALPVDLPALPVQAPEAVPALSADNAVETTQSAVTDVTGDLPVVGDLPVDVPAVTDVAGVGGNLPNVGDVLDKLPVNLPVDVPAVNLPDVSQVVPQVTQNLPVIGGDASGHNIVGDVVGQTGLGNVINDNPVTDVVGNVVPDLGLL
ncbi:IniB N-terminal domain-containing protein [Kibdelosporangium persicum]|uniref:Uncharacterized protein n=1 Tax=Kibdelosporangium persicum TaxID=2698649 RepID=A0ABX2FIM3_9PSEU|nr:IniB N-terminal domain-containing protein [Kibdelosporangium persicum]NRN71276.1 hypothetical protein [Kibdelosporangium persicum]